MSTRLDPEEALSRPLYLVALMLILVPALDFVLSVPPPRPAGIEWRFGAVGLLSGYLLTPILGLALAFIIAVIGRQVGVQRLIVIACFLLAVLLFVLCAVFLLDMVRLRPSIPQDGRPAFNSAWTRAMAKLALSAGTLLYFGWRARRVLPAPSRHREPRPVIVVPK